MSPRFAFVLSQFPALSETFVVNQVTGLLDRGVEVEVLSGHRVEYSRMHPEVERYDLIDRTYYGSALPKSRLRLRARVARTLAAAAFRRLRSPADLDWLLAYGRKDAWTALPFAHLEHLRRRHFDAILCHFGPQGNWGLALRNIGLLSGRLVTVFHGYDLSRFLEEEGERAYDRLFREGDLFLPVSNFWKQKLIELGCPEDRIVVHRMGVQLDQFRFVSREPPGEPLRLVSVARLTEKKGLEYGIRAAAELVRTGTEVRYDIIGSGPDADALQKLIDSLGLARLVRLVGPKEKGGVLAAMREAHILLAPSVTGSDGNREGLPVVLMEALATGLPVVSTRHTGIPELIQHGETGMLAEERDVSGLVEGVLTLVRNPELYAAIAAAGRHLVERNHDVDNLNDQLAHLLTHADPHCGSSYPKRANASLAAYGSPG